MAQEIERKFLVKDATFKDVAFDSVRIVQGYLSSVAERTVRVRLKGEVGFITVKGVANESGVSRYEWEKEISKEDAAELLKICDPGVIDKTRFLVEFDGHTYEVDEFYGDNEGLIVAEIELSDEDEAFGKPTWLGKEVTGDNKYYNSMLKSNPFKIWK